MQPQVRAENTETSHIFPVLTLLFAGSGCAALIYEIVWYQLLQLAIGSTAVSLGILLATFMGGLCIGSLGLPRLRRAQENPLRTYALLETGMAICGLLVLFCIPFIDRIYFTGAAHGLPGMLLRGILSAICLLPPTVLMGATLPTIVRALESTPRGVAQWGLLYGANTVGAVFGCLCAGFYLLRLYDTAIATYAAVCLNLTIALVSLWLSSQQQSASGADATTEASGSSSLLSESASSDWTVYVTIAISGACALGGEVIWTRLMGMMMGSTVYVFSIILAVFLGGIAVGSALGSLILPSVHPRTALGACQLLSVCGIAWTAYMISDSLPYWPINPLLSVSPWSMFQLDLLRGTWAVLPPTLLWGASFPFAMAAVAARGKDPGRQVGGVYAANTFGAIIGALGISLVLIPWIGTQQSQRVLLSLSAVSALVILLPEVWQRRSIVGLAYVTAGIVLAIVLARGLHPVPGELIAYGRRMSINIGNSNIVYTAEGRNSSVAISRWSDGAVGIDVNGHVEATNEIYDMKLQRMVGHLPALLHPNPKSVLGIGFGAGVSAGTFTRYPGIEKITVCEIEPIIPPISSRFFAKEDYDVLHNPRTHMVYDDARHYVLTTQEKFDVIASDPLDVFVKGTAALYSKEYFEAIKRHLNPGGMFTLYVPLYESDTRTIQSELATFFEVFPYGTIWGNTRDGQGYDMVFMGQSDPLQINLDEVQQRLDRPDYAPVAESMRDIGVSSAVDLFSTFAGQKSDFQPWLQGAQITSDKDLRLQYLAGWGIDSSLQESIYAEMLKYRRTPQNLFIGSDRYKQALLSMLTSGGATVGQP